MLHGREEINCCEGPSAGLTFICPRLAAARVVIAARAGTIVKRAEVR